MAISNIFQHHGSKHNIYYFSVALSWHEICEICPLKGLTFHHFKETQGSQWIRQCTINRWIPSMMKIVIKPSKYWNIIGLKIWTKFLNQQKRKLFSKPFGTSLVFVPMSLSFLETLEREKFSQAKFDIGQSIFLFVFKMRSYS